MFPRSFHTWYALLPSEPAGPIGPSGPATPGSPFSPSGPFSPTIAVPDGQLPLVFGPKIISVEVLIKKSPSTPSFVSSGSDVPFKIVLPSEPAGPVGPSGPATPGSPFSPVFPSPPLRPWTPFSPCSPLSP